MAPSRKKGGRAAAAAAAARQQWKVGDLVLAKMKGFPAWPAIVSKPEKWGYSSDRKKLLVYFYGTKQMYEDKACFKLQTPSITGEVCLAQWANKNGSAFCNYADIEAFTEEKKKSLLVKRQGKGADFVRAVDEIIDIYDKKQNLAEVNSSDEGNNPSNGHLEDPRSKSSRNSPEDSCHVNDNHQSEAVCASTENHNVINPEEVPRTSVERNPQDTSILNDEPSEKLSILDQLRQTPLSTTTTTRKRQRDGSLQTSVIQRVPSLRRSRSSSGIDPCKFQKLLVRGKGADQSGNNLVSNVLQEESTLKKMTADVAHVLPSSNGGFPASAGFPSCCEDAVSDKTATRSDSEAGGMLELEKSKNGYLDKDLGLNEVTLNGKFDHPIKAAILKKKRKPNRKRATDTLEYATLEKEVELHESLPVSPNSGKELAENFSKADGDEHLPLVKRARVRMGKPSVEETQLNEFVEKKEKLEEKTEKLELVASLEESDMCVKPSSPLSSPADGTPFRVREAPSSSLVNDYAFTTGRDSMIWKVNKFKLKGITVDVEAALPPSKRLHRALEAMSANAAEAIDDTPEGPSDMEIGCNGCTDSPEEDPFHQPVDGNVESPTRSQCIQSSENNACYNDTSELSSSLASLSPEVHMLTLSKVESDIILTQSLRMPKKKDCEEVGVKDCDESSISKILAVDIQEKVLQPCSFKSVEQQMNTSSGDGASAQLCSPLGEIKTSQPSKECSYPLVDGVNESGSMEPDVEKLVPVMNSKESDEFLHPNGTAVDLLATNVASAASNASDSTKSPSSQSDESLQARDMPDAVREVKHKVTPKDWGTSDLMQMKDLIAAAQAKCLLSRSTSFPDNVVDGKVFADSVVSVINSSDSSVLGSPQNSMVYHRPATDDRPHNLQNGSRSPFVGQREKGSNKLAARMKANVARSSFEALLCTLSRTKDSIGRATRMAIDCAKFGIAGEVIEILLQHLERESSLYKRVDLFFLVDSITQFSCSQKGVVGDVYLSLVQSMLPRLLSAAAPHGNAARENRRQCLKVLRLWLERKTLPESVVRHHIRDLESVNETSLTSSYSRRPSRTERALNDPIREMEGMFVDEYGSNTSFHLQHFIHPRLLQDEEGSGDDEKSFEAVTPEGNVGVEDEKGTTQTPGGKHRHILEDVDGELEMEDVAPPCGVGASSTSHVSGAETTSDAHHHHEQHQSLPCAPPLPEDLPPSPPPLPSSPPPMAPPCPAPNCLPQQQLGRSHANADVTDFQLCITHNNQDQQPQPVSQQTNNYQGNSISSESMPCYTYEYGSFQNQMPAAHCSLGSSGPFTSHTTIYPGNNIRLKMSTPLPNKGYTLQPPPPTVSNQFSYIQAEAQQIAPSWGSFSSFGGDRFQYVHDPQGGNFYCDRNIRGPIQHENVEKGRFSSVMNTGHVLSDKAETYPSSHSHTGPYPEAASNPPQGWSFPPRISSYSSSASRSPLEIPMSQVTGAPGYWRPK